MKTFEQATCIGYYIGAVGSPCRRVVGVEEKNKQSVEVSEVFG